MKLNLHLVSKKTNMKKYLFFFLISSITLQSFSQNKWKPFAGIHISGNSDLYYVGPSFSGGVIHPLGKTKKWNWVPELQYFRKYSKYDEIGNSHSWDRFISFSIRSNFNYQIGKNTSKGIFVGGGLGFQYAKDECATVTQNGTIKEENLHYDAIRYGVVMLTFNAGYNFPLKKNKSLQAIITAIGPHTAKDDLGEYIEIISVLNAGIRIQF